MNRNPILIFVTILRKNHPPGPSSIVHPRKRPFLWMETKMGAPEKAEIAFRRKIAYFLYEKDLCYSAGGGGGLRRPRARKGVVWCTRGGLRPSRARKGVVWCTRGGLRPSRARKGAVWCTRGGLRPSRARKGVVWCTRGGLRPSRARKGAVWCTRGGLVHLSSLDFVPVDADFTEVPDEIGGDGYLELLGIELNVIVGDGVVEV